jgi:hypothetical protein
MMKSELERLSEILAPMPFEDHIALCKVYNRRSMIWHDFPGADFASLQLQAALQLNQEADKNE